MKDDINIFESNNSDVGSGQSTLSLADLPFVYSITNILVILYTGTVDINRFYVAGLIAGLIGTFLVIVHPIQLGLDRRWRSISHVHSKYSIKFVGAVPPEKEIEMETININRSLKLVAIKYEKDKIVGAIYFIVILTVIFSALLTPNFQKAMGFDIPFSSIWYLIEVGLLVMIGITVLVLFREILSFNGKLKICGMYYFLIKKWGQNPNIRPRLDEIKHSIDNNDWDIAKQLVDQELLNLWGNL